MNLEDLELMQQLAIYEAQEDFWAFRQYMNPNMKKGWWQRQIAGVLMDFYRELISGLRPKYVIEAPPQHGKSFQVIDFIAWLFGRHPEFRTFYTSFSDRLGVRANLRLQRIMDNKKYIACFPETKLSQSPTDSTTRNKEMLEIVGREGFFRNTTVRGAITGEGLDCVVEGTFVNTDQGLIPIELLNSLPLSVNILAYSEKGLSYERLLGFARRESVDIWKITTNSGRVLECTSDHQVFTQERGYCDAASLSTSDFLLCSLQERLSAPSLRCNEVVKTRRSRKFLLEGMQRFLFLFDEKEKMRRVRREYNKILKVLRSLPGKKPIIKNSQGIPEQDGEVRNLFKRIFIERKHKWYLFKILFSNLRKFWAFNRNAWEEQSKLARWIRSDQVFASQCEGLSPSKAENHDERQCGMRSMQIRLQDGSASHRRFIKEQFSFESSDALPRLPQGSASNYEKGYEFERIAKIERSRSKAVTYDITVENCHNFFANGILVHNCGIVDDPIKGRSEAGSETVRDATWDWFTDDFFTRFSEDAGLLFILTRWHIDDPVGRLMATENNVKVFKYPALAVKDEKYRKEGEPLFPEHKSKEFILERKNIMDKNNFESLYQQNPQIVGGQVVQGSWFKRYGRVPPLKYRMIYGDTAMKVKQHNDYSVFQHWGMGLDGRIYLLDQIRGKWEAPELKRRCIDFWIKCKIVDPVRNTGGELRGMKIEDKASGTGLIQEIKEKGRIPITGIERNIDKLTRVQDASPSIEAGYVWIPEEAPWVNDYVFEFECFSRDDSHVNDDQIDPTCDAIKDMIGDLEGLGDWEKLI